jgi:pilus assembly protein Flp/PilA
MTTLLRNFWHDDSGATAIEYGLIAALVAVAIIAVLGALGGSLQDIFQTVSTELDGAATGTDDGTTPTE